RSSSFQGARIRGVSLAEPLGYRWAGAAMLKVIAVGTEAPQGDQSKQRVSTVVVPPSPRAISVAAAESILGSPVPEPLRPHPPAAAGGRYGWSVLLLLAVLLRLAVLGLLGVPAVLGSAELWWLVGGVSVLGAPATWLLARDNAAGLGHLITTEHVVLRSGSVF